MMGYESLTAADAKLWLLHRNQFPVTQRLIYLNHAAVAPLCRPAAEAMKQLADDVCQNGSYNYDKWLDAYQGLRVAAGQLIQADPGEIAITKNTSEGIAMVANGIGWRPGDKVVAFREEFPANFFPWKRLERQGVQVECLSCDDSLERIDQAARGAKLLSISFVQYLSGQRLNLTALGEICRRNGCLFFVDAIQGLGAFPIDVRTDQIDALSADGHKWLLGPEGCGILYIRRDLLDEIEPAEFGWTNVARYADYASRDMTLRSDAGRYECGTLNTIGIFGLRAAIEFLLDVGVAEIAPAVQTLGDRLAAGVEQKGYEQLHRRSRESGSGIVSFRKPGTDSRYIVRILKEHGIIAAPRMGWVRTSPHFYVSPDEIDRVVDVLP
jgi:selenocysteine lyase/cysteine desulfurase